MLSTQVVQRLGLAQQLLQRRVRLRQQQAHVRSVCSDWGQAQERAE